MTPAGARKVRIATAVAIMCFFAYVAAMLIPPYFQNSRFQGFLDDVVARTSSPEILKTEIVNKAAQLGLPLQEGNIRVLPLANGGLKADVLYVSRVDLKLYTVDLHFHPSASR